MEFLSEQSLLYSALILSLCFYLLFFLRQIPPSPKSTPSSGLKLHPLLGILPAYLKNRHRFLDWITEVFAAGPTQSIVFHSPGQLSGVLTADALNVEHVLKNNFDNYPKGERIHFGMEDFLGDGIFNVDGEAWRLQRKTASFEFNKRSLRNFVVETVRFEIVDRLLPLLRRAAGKDAILDLQDVLERFAFDNICKVAFGVDPACLEEEGAAGREAAQGFMEAFDAAAKLSSGRFFDPLTMMWRVKKFLNVGSERRLREANRVVRDYAMGIIRSRKESPAATTRKDDLLSRFACNPDNTDEFLRDVVVNFVLAGRETTSSALTWFFWLLSSRPEIQRRILEEIISIRSKAATITENRSSDTISFDGLREMQYLHAAITESLRLYPPVALDTLTPRDDDVLPDGTFVGKGWFLTYSAYSMGRMEKIWGKDCCQYRPERWLVDGVFQPESPFRFPAFHAGPRMCLGKEMAYIQMKSIAATVIERFAVEVVEKEKTPEHNLSLTLRMKGGLPVRVRKR